MKMEGSNQPVKTALTDFLKSHNIEDVDGSVDDIVLDYVVSILEDLGQADVADDMDVDGFIEMMEAYVPGFGAIDSVRVCEWMFELAGKSSKSDTSDKVGAVLSLKPVELQSPNEHKAGKLALIVNGGSDAESKSLSLQDEAPDPKIEILLEMFPNSCALEVTHCLVMSSGDTDSAAQLILHRQQNGDAITEGSPQYRERNVLSPKKDDKKVREQMLAKYAYIDEHDDRVVHKPITPKQCPKKMVRYLDGRVVSTKGERFTEVKKEEDEEMKKTYVNLKPARKYRFH
ncbi:CUE domain-containing protein 2-like [Liolophura sinensis]|uniref:CUE domain-containing protein 2-like n=1 Tax=Liolophura sinensis TaxID=3198878 RepID=UPI0031598492